MAQLTSGSIANTFATLIVNSVKQSDTGCHSERSEESNRLLRRGVYSGHTRGTCTERIEVLSVNSAEGLLAVTVVTVLLQERALPSGLVIKALGNFFGFISSKPTVF